jgi:cell division protein FtsN
VVGNMGAFYRVRVGPFATQNEGQQVCAKLKGSGLDCMVVTE